MAAVIGTIGRVIGSTMLRGASLASKTTSKLSENELKIISDSINSKEKAHQDNMTEIDKFTTQIQKELIQKIQKQIGLDDITFTGNLRQNINPGMEGEFKSVEADTPYAYFVEYGIPPGKTVNFDALRNWVENKLKIKDEEELYRVTFAVSNKIKSKGINPKRFMKKGIKSLIAKRGAIGTKNISRKFKQKPSRVTRISKFIIKTSKRITKYLNKIDKIRRMLK